MMNVLPDFALNSLARPYPERSRFSGGARDLPHSGAAIVTAAKPAINCGTDNWPLATANWPPATAKWTNQ